MTHARQRYHLLSISLHWLIALAIIGLCISGLWMVDAINVPETQNQAFELYQIHKASGLSVLVLMLVRISLRFAFAAPSYEGLLDAMETRLAHLGHIGLYGILMLVPILGWAMVSASVWGLPTIWFGLFEWPHLSFLSDLPPAEKKPVEDLLKLAHRWAAYGLMALAAGHITMALKHQFKDGKQMLSRMLPTRSTSKN